VKALENPQMLKSVEILSQLLMSAKWYNTLADKTATKCAMHDGLSTSPRKSRSAHRTSSSTNAQMWHYGKQNFNE